ncbi:MAG: rhodanese-like domain-containing protein [bacterium]
MSTPAVPPPPPPPPIDASGLPVGYTFKPDWDVKPRDLRDALASGTQTPLVLDCRRDDEWAFCRIPGAVHFAMNTIEQRLDEVEEAAGGRDKPIVVNCHHGVRSLRVTAALRAWGFSNVKSLAGGIDLWSIDIDPSVPRY